MVATDHAVRALGEFDEAPSLSIVDFFFAQIWS
jgi:hypothetical protein